jgi:hypothetical protein
MQEVETMPGPMPETAAVPMYGGVRGCRNEADLELYRSASKAAAEIRAGRQSSRPLEEIMRELGELPNDGLEG